MTPPTLTTKHLILRHARVEDASALHPMYHDPEAMRYWHAPPHPDIATTQTELAQILDTDVCYWTICRRDDEHPIGNISYLDTTIPRPGMGYFLHPDYWRQGLMTEAAQAVLNYGFTQLALEGVELWIDEGNRASQRLAQKLGFTRRGHFQQRFDHRAAPHTTLVFGLYRWEWDATARSEPNPMPHFDAVRPQLAVPDVMAAAKYYRDQLEFSIAWLGDEPPMHGIVAHRDWMATGVCIHLQHTDTPPTTPGMVLIIDVSSDIEALYAQYVAQGIDIVMPIVTQPWGSREFAIADLNGYRLRFTAPG